jgi:RNA polymerase sigma-70 factor (ECF subfamily)
VARVDHVPGSVMAAGAAAQDGHLSEVGAAERVAFEAATGPLYPFLVRRLVLILGNLPDAEDVAQETYLRAYRSWPAFDGRDVRAWLYTIALRLAFNELRGRHRWSRLLGRGEPSAWNDPVDPDLLAALRALDARTRTALLLSAVDGYRQREIAAMMGVPEGTVASWISRGRAQLRADLAT